MTLELKKLPSVCNLTRDLSLSCTTHLRICRRPITVDRAEVDNEGHCAVRQGAGKAVLRIGSFSAAAVTLSPAPFPTTWPDSPRFRQLFRPATDRARAVGYEDLGGRAQMSCCPCCCCCCCCSSANRRARETLSGEATFGAWDNSLSRS